MESLKKSFNKVIITFFLFTLVPDIFADSPYKKTIYNAFINREMYKWENVINIFETNVPTPTVDQKLELIDYYYGYIGYLINKKEFSKAENLVIKGEKIINGILLSHPRNATAYAYKGSFIGYRISISKFKALFLGSESVAYVNKAFELDPQNIQAIIDKGNILYYSPGIFGGNIDEALKFYIKGSKLIEKNKDTYQNWAYLNLLTMIGIIYEKKNKLGDAKLIYEKILRIEPNFYWIKADLYPKLLVKMQP